MEGGGSFFGGRGWGLEEREVERLGGMVRMGCVCLVGLFVTLVAMSCASPLSCDELSMTLRYREDCDRELEEENIKSLLVTGTGGSGTHSVSYYLNKRHGIE